LRFLGLLLLLNGSTLNQESLNHGVQWWLIDDSTDKSNCSVASRSTLIQGSSGGYKRVRVWLRFARRHKSLSNITFPAMDSIASYAPIPSEVVMSQILQTGEIFKLTTGSPEFLYTSVLFAQDGATFEANFFGRGKVDPRKLLDVQHIPPHSSCSYSQTRMQHRNLSGKMVHQDTKSDVLRWRKLPCRTRPPGAHHL
jgi:hypothetical protein